MALITWKEEYSVNVTDVDNEHKKLVELVNILHDAMMQGKAKDVMGTILEELANYTVNHFKTEENYFDKYNYPDSEIHKKQHSDLVNQVVDLQAKLYSGEKVLTIDVMNFLRDWLAEHILDSDKQFGPFLNSKGVY